MAKRKLPIEDPFATPDAKTKEGIVPGVESEEEASASKDTKASTKSTKKKTTKKKTTKKPAAKKTSSKRPAIEDPFADPDVKTKEGIIPGLDLQSEPEPEKPVKKKATRKKTTKKASTPPKPSTTSATKADANEGPVEFQRLQATQQQILEHLTSLSAQLASSSDEQPVLERLNTLEEYLHQLEQQLPGVEAQQFDTSALLETQQQLQQQLTQVPNEVLEPVLSRLQELQTGQGQLQEAVTAQAESTTETPSLAPVEDSLQQLQNALSQVQARLEEPTEFPTPEAVDLSGVEDRLNALQEQIQSLESSLKKQAEASPEPVVSEPVDLNPILEVVESLKEELSSIPGPTIVSTTPDSEVDLEPVVTLLQGVRQELRQQAEVLEQLPSQFPTPPKATTPTLPEVDLSPLHSSLETLSERVEALNLRFVEENREETSQSTRKEAISDWPSGPWEKLQSRLQEIHDDLLILPDTPLTMRMESLDERLLQWKTELSEAQAALEEKMLSNFSHNQTSTETEAERNRRETRQLLEEQQASLQTSLDSFSQQWSATLATLEAQQSQEPQHSNDTTAALAESAIHLDLKALQNRLDAQQEVLASWQETFMASLETSLSSLSGGQVILDNHVQEFHQALNPLHNSIQGLSQQFETLQELQEEQQKHLKQTQAALNSLAAQSQTENPQSALQTDSSTQELMFKTLESRVFGDEMVQRLTMTGLIALLAVGLMAVPEGLFGQWVFKKWLYVVPMLWTASGWFGLVTLQRRWDETLERAKALGRAFLDEDQEIFRGWMIKLSHRLLGLLLVFQLLLFFFF